MGYTQFYEGIGDTHSKMRISDLFSETFKRHSHTEMEYALAAGGIYDSADGESMLQKWNKPWLWFRALLILLALAVVDYTFIYIMSESLGKTPYPVFGYTYIMFATLVTPIPLLILIWELNVPRNISIFSLGLYFIIGGFMSLFITALFNEIDWGDAAWVAPFAEEPGKLLAALLLLYFFIRKDKSVYGMTGLVIGAAVGTGFTVFETYQYAYNLVMQIAEEMALISWKPSIVYLSQCAQEYGTKIIFLRSIPGLNGHLLYCAPYVGAFAMAYHKRKSWLDGFADPTFWVFFVVGCLLHGLWNSDYNAGWGTSIILSLLGLISLFIATRMCFKQVVNEGQYSSGDKDRIADQRGNQDFVLNGGGAVARNVIKMTGTWKKADGSVWNGSGSNANSFMVGRDPSCNLSFPIDANGVSRQHCVVSLSGGQYYVQDQNSSCGTFINGKRLNPSEKVNINSSDKIYLGSTQVYIQIV